MEEQGYIRKKGNEIFFVKKEKTLCKACLNKEEKEYNINHYIEEGSELNSDDSVLLEADSWAVLRLCFYFYIVPIFVFGLMIYTIELDQGLTLTLSAILLSVSLIYFYYKFLNHIYANKKLLKLKKYLDMELESNSIIMSFLFLGALAFLLGSLLLLAHEKFKVEENPEIEKINDLLPQNNCGACGFPGCKSFAENLVTKKQAIVCPVCSEERMQEIFAELKLTGVKVDKMKAVVNCIGNNTNSLFIGEYRGIKDCNLANSSESCVKQCEFGCVGLGNCQQACMYGAIKLINGIAVIDPKKCVGCGKCVEACPRNLIELIPEKSSCAVLCRSKDKGVDVKKVCSVGCIKCQKCIKVCKKNAISLVDGTIKIDYSLCDNCMECVNACISKCIKEV